MNKEFLDILAKIEKRKSAVVKSGCITFIYDAKLNVPVDNSISTNNNPYKATLK